MSKEWANPNPMFYKNYVEVDPLTDRPIIFKGGKGYNSKDSFKTIDRVCNNCGTKLKVAAIGYYQDTMEVVCPECGSINGREFDENMLDV